MTERTPWWKAFLPKKKSGSTKESNHVFGPDFDPFAQNQKQKDPNVSSKSSGGQSHSQHESNNSSLISDETYDDSQLYSVFNEQTCRRNMKVSRSGRFKVKGKVRSTLPIEERERERAQPQGKTA
ncbi:proline-rich protein 15 [Nothobranchius furzeri]|uniref:Proline-rich protein 15-like n=1 Tax=Nothobranchius furzeri TaxID=105023 RepID=A0A9D2YJ25_NOTFU|nr:proline-rich protein 15 [Nothobranchius furzeri]XP_054600552.1 proline-rich protein 15 [Nothobranchius furzeri]KAF7221731.1 proline-rich protein 15-like [Nothobranchius furzeri]